jgi:hypothetical protein
MAADAKSDPANEENTPAGRAPMRTVALGVLSMFVDCAAANVGFDLPDGGGTMSADSPQHDLNEARLAIDAANALLAAVGRALSADERSAIEGLLTQLQIAYVKRAGV